MAQNLSVTSIGIGVDVRPLNPVLNNAQHVVSNAVGTLTALAQLRDLLITSIGNGHGTPSTIQNNSPRTIAGGRYRR